MEIELKYLVDDREIARQIFEDEESLKTYLKRNKEKTCETMKPAFIVDEYREYKNTQVRKLTPEEVEKYMSER